MVLELVQCRIILILEKGEYTQVKQFFRVIIHINERNMFYEDLELVVMSI